MERSGCYSFALGIESGSDRVLKMMKKSSSVRKISEKIRLISENTNIRMTGFLICGYPGETEDDLRQTEKLIMREPLDRIAVGPFIPLPGTEIYKELLREKKLSENHNWDSFSPYEERVFTSGTVSAERLLKFLRNMHLRFYLRPKIMFGVLSEINSFKQFKVALKMFLFWLGIVKFKKN
jgi:radical SAM superfamily enzyme YgiQ (UPF0313 family)